MSPPRRCLALLLAPALTLAVVPPARPAAAPRPRLDLHGDPLPPGAVARLGTVRLRHGGKVTTVAFAPDGKALAAVSYDGTVSLWEPRGGREIRRIPVPPRTGCDYVCWSADGKALYGVSQGYHHLWDAATGALRNSKKVHGYDMHLLPDPRMWVILDRDGPGRFDPKTGKVRRYEGLELPMSFQSAVSPDGKTVALGPVGEGVGRLWDLDAGKEVGMFGSRHDHYSAMEFAPDGKTFAAALTGGRAILVRRASDGREVYRLKGYQKSPYQLAFAPDGRRLAAGGEDGSVSVWDLGARRLRCTFAADGGRLHSLTFSPDGALLAWGGEHHVVRVAEVATGRPLHRASPHPDGVGVLAFSPDGKTVASSRGYSSPADPETRARGEPAVVLWDADTGRVRHRAPYHDGTVVSMAFDARGAMLFWVREDHSALKANNHRYTVCSCPAGGGAARARFDVWDHPGFRRAVLSPDAKEVAVIDPEGGTVELWDVATGTKRKTLRDLGKLHSARFSDDGKLLAGLRPDGPAVWDKDGKRLRAHAFKILYGDGRLACAAGGKAFARGDTEGVLVWDVPGRDEPRPLGKGTGAVAPLTFSPDGETLAAANKDGSVGLWDVAAGRLRRQLVGHRGSVNALAFSRDGRRLVSGGSDGTVLVWELSARDK